MNILGGIVEPDAGDLLIEGERYQPRRPQDAEKAGIAFIQQELNIFPNLSVEENLFVRAFPTRGRWLPVIARRQMRARALECLKLVSLDVDPGLPAGRLPPGERQLLEIAKALSVDARLIIFDEPTTSLTATECARLFALIAALKAQGLAIIYISHVLGDVMRLADAITALRDGEVVWSGSKSETSIDGLIAAMVGRSIKTLFPERQARPAERPVRLAVEGVCRAGVVKDISFHLHAGEILGIAGMMGSGRTELARIVFGLDSYDEGRLAADGLPLARGKIAARLAAGLAFLTEDRREEGLLMDHSVGANLALAALTSFARGPLQTIDAAGERSAASAMSARLNIKSSARQPLEAQARALSGGNQQKVVLGKWLLRDPRVLILDEPTRGVDVGAKEEIYKLIATLADAGMAVLLISSEIEELIGLSDRIMVLRRGEIVGTFARADFDQEAILRVATLKERAA